MELFKRKHGFIEHHIPRYIHPTCRDFKTLEALMKRTITQRDTSGRPELEFPLIEGPKVGPIGATKCSEGLVIRFNT
jgi:hypothetical protein